MKQAFRKYFIPHADNQYHPHILHTKRAVFYSIFFVSIKIFIFFSIAFLPMAVFTLPEILAEQQIKIITLTNSFREQLGKRPLSVSQKLVYSADLKARDMATMQYFSHVSPENRNLRYFLSQAGYAYRVAGENLGMGFMDADSVVAAWINSPTHYDNIIDPEFVEIGVNLAEGVYQDIPTVFTVQHFGTPKEVVLATSVGADETDTVVTSTLVSAEEVVQDSVLQSSGEVRVVSDPVSEEEYVDTSVSSAEDGILVAQTEPLTPIEKYTKAEKMLPFATSILQFTNSVYIGFIIMFGVAFVCLIVFEIRRQHPHIIIQTLALISLLAVLLVV